MSNSRVLGPASEHGCVGCGARADSWQHRVAKGRGGPTDLFNCVPLCGDGTRGCHGWAEHNPGKAQAYLLDIPGSFDRGRYVGPDPAYRWHYNGEVWTDDGGWQTMGRCPHDMDPRACLTCDPPPVEPVRVSDPFRAEYDGVCAGCEFDVVPGQWVRYVGPRIHHAGACADDAARSARA